MFSQLRITDADEKAMYRAKLAGRTEPTKAREPALAQLRTDAKKDFRKLEGFTAAERDAFDAMVDHLVEGLLKEMKQR